MREVGVRGAGRKAKETEGKGNGGRDEEKRKGRDRGHRSLGPLIPAGLNAAVPQGRSQAVHQTLPC